MAGDDFNTTVEQLYGGPPAQFIAEREAAVKRARAAGDRELADRIKQLRRPTAAASLLNHHRRSGGDQDLQDLVDFGERLRTAQRELDVPAMRSLGAERTPRIAAVVDAVAAGADEQLTATVREQLSQTLTAAVADADAARAVLSGRLVAALSYSGFGEVDLRDAVAVPLADDRTPAPPGDTGGSPGAEEPEEDDRQREDLARADPARADRERKAAERQLEEALAILAKAQQAQESAVQAAQLAERALTAARRTAKSARARAAQATAAREAAEAEVSAARDRVSPS